MPFTKMMPTAPPATNAIDERITEQLDVIPEAKHHTVEHLIDHAVSESRETGATAPLLKQLIIAVLKMT